MQASREDLQNQAAQSEVFNVTNLRDFRPGHRTNILFFHPFLNGSSSLVNTLLCDDNVFVTAPADVPLSTSVIRGVQPDGSVYGAPVSNATSPHDICTTDYGEYRYNDEVFILDPWGWTGRESHEYGDNVFVRMLNGQLSAGTKRSYFHPSEDPISPSDPSSAIHLVVFLVSFGVAEQLIETENRMLELGDEEDEDEEKPFMHYCLVRYLKICGNMGIPYIVGVTKMDVFMNESALFSPNIDLRLESKPEIAWKKLLKAFQELVYPMQRAIQDSEIPIIPVISYNSTDEFHDEFIQFSSRQFVRVLLRTLKTLRPRQFIRSMMSEYKEMRMGEENGLDLFDVAEEASWSDLLIQRVVTESGSVVPVFSSLISPFEPDENILSSDDFNDISPSVVLDLLLHGIKAWKKILQAAGYRHLFDYYRFFICMKQDSLAEYITDLIRSSIGCVYRDPTDGSTDPDDVLYMFERSEDSRRNLDLLVDLMTLSATKEEVGTEPMTIVPTSDFTVACLDALVYHLKDFVSPSWVVQDEGSSPLLQRLEKAAPWLSTLRNHVDSGRGIPCCSEDRLPQLLADLDDPTLQTIPPTMRIISPSGDYVLVHAIVMCASYATFFAGVRSDLVEMKNGMIEWQMNLPIKAVEVLKRFAYTSYTKDSQSILPHFESPRQSFVLSMSILSFLFQDLNTHDDLVKLLLEQVLFVGKSLLDSDQLSLALAWCGPSVISDFGVDRLKKLFRCFGPAADELRQSLDLFNSPPLTCELALLQQFAQEDGYCNVVAPRLRSLLQLEISRCKRDPTRMKETRIQLLNGRLEFDSQEAVLLVCQALESLNDEQEEEGEGEGEGGGIDLTSLRGYFPLDLSEMVDLWSLWIEKKQVEDNVFVELIERLIQKTSRQKDLQVQFILRDEGLELTTEEERRLFQLTSDPSDASTTEIGEVGVVGEDEEAEETVEIRRLKNELAENWKELDQCQNEIKRLRLNQERMQQQLDRLVQQRSRLE